MQEIKKINLSLEWKSCKIGDVVSVRRGSSPRPIKDYVSETGMPWVKIADATKDQTRFINFTSEFIKEEGIEKSVVVNPGDLIVSNSATPGLPKFMNIKACVHDGWLVFDSYNGILKDFLYYYFIVIRGRLVNQANGSVFKNLKTDIVRNFDINLPDLETQEKIVKILSQIDKKIETTIKINKNLEEQLLRIFDSWFLKFELSNEFSDSKLGLIPKGWKIDYLGSKKSCSIIKSGIDEFDNSKIYIATADVDNSIITSNDTLITMDDKPSRANMQPISNSIWFAKMIDSKKLIMVDEYCNDLLNNYIFSTGFCGLKCVDKYFYYLWTFLLTDVFDVMKNNFCTGTTMQAINNKDTKLIEFVLPDDKTITQFNSIAKPMFKKIYYNNLEIKKLQRLRDTLLPKLMSGEIDVSEVNCDLKIIIRKIYIKSSKLFLWRYLSENKNYIKNTKSNETLLKSRTIYKINKFLAKFNARYRYYRQ